MNEGLFNQRKDNREVVTTKLSLIAIRNPEHNNVTYSTTSIRFVKKQKEDTN